VFSFIIKLRTLSVAYHAAVFIFDPFTCSSCCNSSPPPFLGLLSVKILSKYISRTCTYGRRKTTANNTSRATKHFTATLSPRSDSTHEHK